MYPISKSSCLLDGRLCVPYDDTVEPNRNAYDACSHLIRHVLHRLLHGIHHGNMRDITKIQKYVGVPALSAQRPALSARARHTGAKRPVASAKRSDLGTGSTDETKLLLDSSRDLLESSPLGFREGKRQERMNYDIETSPISFGESPKSRSTDEVKLLLDSSRDLLESSPLGFREGKRQERMNLERWLKERNFATTHLKRLEKVDKICMTARSSPFDKLLMVQCLKQKGHVVAVTGDGIHDAQHSRKLILDSMGIQGTEVAKESSDIVILDDNFAFVVTVLRRGSATHNSAATIMGLITDKLDALALATEMPTMDLMAKPPVGRTKPLITNVIEFNARKMEKRKVFKGIHRSKLLFLKKFADTERLNWGNGLFA
ncbi:hypothetical protein Fmac_003105 [Flemingia macrophylla]|uniref:Uncharacterized protein n=1 Tax=Flemingia macrophylla TaxID=520843 RepID=A0ABD1NLV8_9FABA